MELSPRLIESQNADRRLVGHWKPNWPSHLPGLSVNDLVWCEGSSLGYLNYSIPDPAERARFFCKCFPTLSLAQLSPLWKADQSLKLELLDWSEVLGVLFGSRSSDANSLMSFFSALPEAVIAWSMERKIGPGDLRAIQSWLKSSNAISQDLKMQILISVASLKLSKSESLKGIELLLECAELGKDISKFLEVSEPSTSNWYEELRQLRYPETFGFDEARERSLATLPLPKGSRVRWNRQGDRGFLEISLQLTRSEDFERAIEALRKTQGELKARDPDYWRGL